MQMSKFFPFIAMLLSPSLILCLYVILFVSVCNVIHDRNEPATC